MDSDSPSPAKRLRLSLHRNIQLTECVREFKLPRQFPSMITRVNTDGINEKNKIRAQFNASAVTCLPKTSLHTKIVNNPEIASSSFTRKIKLKGKDGRDLGEVNVQDLPQNIQGKTITLAKNGIIETPEKVSGNDKNMGITIGVLTPINILKSEKTEKLVNNLSSLGNVKEQKESMEILRDCKDAPIVNQKQINNVKKSVVIEQKQMSAVMDSQGQPQVLVFQSGKNWHMVKLRTSAAANVPQNGKNLVLGKLPTIPQAGNTTIFQTKEQNHNFVANEQNHNFVAKERSQNIFDKSFVSRKVCNTNNSETLIKTVERCKTKSPVAGGENVEINPKMEILRVSMPVANKSVSSISTALQINARKLSLENTKSVTKVGQSSRNNTSLRKDVMVVLPSDIPDSLDSDSDIGTVTQNVQTENSKTDDFSMAKFGSKFSKDNEIAKYRATRDVCSAKKETKKLSDVKEKEDEISNHLNILTKALSTVEDKELRAKALRALADCGIGAEKLVPICPPPEMRSVKDSDTQTPVFGIVEPENFVYISQENPDIKRIRPIERKAPEKIGHIIGNPHPQELGLNTFDLTNWETPNACNDLDAMVSAFLGENAGVTEVRNILADKPTQVPNKLVSQLIQDFQTYKTFDQDGLLSLHRAVIDDDLRSVSRLLSLFRENPDALTADGQTSLELAIRYEVSPKIVRMLLEAGANPTSSEVGHDSALIMSSKKSLPILKDLISYVTTSKSLDNYDSSGFAALHYCAQNNNKSGVIDLANASADVNVRDRRSGRTALFHAIENEHIELAQLLLDRGAQANIASYSGHTIFALVEEGKHHSLVTLLNRIAK